MIDWFVILTPVLLLGVIALLGFIGCNQVFGINETILAIHVTSVQPSSGPTQGGQQVIVTGSAFEPHATVTFGGLAGTVISIDNSGGVIVVQTPSHSSGPVDVVVTNPDNNSGTLLSTDPNHYSYAAVINIGQTLIVPGSNNPAGAMAQGAVAFSDTPKLVIVTVLWPPGGGTLASLIVTGATFQPPLKIDLWSGYNVQTAYAANVPPGTNVIITATLSLPTVPSPWFMCVTVYDNADQSTPTYAPNSLNSVASGTITPINLNVLEASDLIYSVVIAQTSGSTFSGFTGKLSAGPTFTEEQNGGFLLIQDQQIAAPGPVAVGASSAGTNAARWYLLAVGVKHS
jgi:hypothetical protein